MSRPSTATTVAEELVVFGWESEERREQAISILGSTTTMNQRAPLHPRNLADEENIGIGGHHRHHNVQKESHDDSGVMGLWAQDLVKPVSNNPSGDWGGHGDRDGVGVLGMVEMVRAYDGGVVWEKEEASWATMDVVEDSSINARAPQTSAPPPVSFSAEATRDPFCLINSSTTEMGGDDLSHLVADDEELW